MVSERLRVAYLVKTFPRLSETFILNEILGVEELGLELEIFSLRRLPPESEHFAAVRFHFSSGNHPRLKDFLQAGYLARTLLRGKFTHLHAHFANLPTTVAEIVKRLTGIRYSFTAHAKDVYLTMPSELTRKIREAECVLTCTAVNQRYLAGLADQGTPVRLAYHGVDVHRFRALRSGDPPRNGDEVPLILSVARLCEKKGRSPSYSECRAPLREKGPRIPYRGMPHPG